MECERSSSSTSSETGAVLNRLKAPSSVSAVTRRMYECTFCKRAFTNAQALGGHMNIHGRDRLNRAKVQNDADVALPMALPQAHRCFYLLIGSMATGREHIVVEGDEIDSELRLGL